MIRVGYVRPVITTLMMTSVVFFALNLAVATAHAQDDGEAPYSPRLVSRAELIDLGIFKRSPMELPFRLVDVTVVDNRGRQDFEHRYAERFETVLAYFTDAYNKQEPVMPLTSEMVRYTTLTHLRVLGLEAAAGSPVGRVTLGVPGLPRHFLLELSQDGAQTVVVFVNAAHTMQYSGVMPARAPFRPAGADLIPFLGN